MYYYYTVLQYSDGILFILNLVPVFQNSSASPTSLLQLLLQTATLLSYRRPLAFGRRGAGRGKEDKISPC